MLSLILDYFLQGNKLRDVIVRVGFFLFNGVLVGVTINDLIRILFGDMEKKVEIEYGIAGIIAASPYIYDKLALMGAKSNNVFLGSGMALGTMFANRSEEGKKVIPI